jgi:hypothetical protein
LEVLDERVEKQHHHRGRTFLLAVSGQSEVVLRDGLEFWQWMPIRFNGRQDWREQSRGDFSEAIFDLVDQVIRRGRAGGDSGRARAIEPVFVKVLSGLDVINARAKSAARGDKFPRIVALGAADNDHDIAAAREAQGGGLPLFRRLTDRVRKPEF